MTKHNDSIALYEEAIASVEMGEGLEGYEDADLTRLDLECDRLLNCIAAIDVYGNTVAFPTGDYKTCRTLKRAINTERRIREV